MIIILTRLSPLMLDSDNVMLVVQCVGATFIPLCYNNEPELV